MLSMKSIKIFEETIIILEEPSDYDNFALFFLHPLEMTMCLA